MTPNSFNYMPLVSSLCGAFFGALGAYWVGRFKEKRDEDKRRYTALLTTQYALYSQWSIAEMLRKDFLESVRNDQDRWQKLKNFIIPYKHIEVPFDELSFLLESKEPNLLQEIHIAEKRYSTCVEMLERVNKTRLELQTKYPPITFNMATGIGNITAPRHEVFILKELTDMLYDSADKALPTLSKTNELVFDFIKANHGNKKGMKFVPIEKST